MEFETERFEGVLSVSMLNFQRILLRRNCEILREANHQQEEEVGNVCLKGFDRWDNFSGRYI